MEYFLKTEKSRKNNHNQQSHTTRNVIGSPSGRKKIIPVGNINLYKRMKSTKNGNILGIDFFLLFKFLKRLLMVKTKIIMCHGVYNICKTKIHDSNMKIRKGEVEMNYCQAFTLYIK